MLVWNPQLEHHLDTFDDKSTKSHEEAHACQGCLEDDTSVPEENIVNAYLQINDEKKQEINDKHSRIRHPIVEWVGMGLLGYCFGGGSTVASGVLLLCTVSMAWLFWERKVSHLGTLRRQQEENRFLECRFELSKLLGSIGAPPLQGTGTPLENANATINYQLVLDFGMAHVSFLREMDYSLDTLRTAVGMHLRTTPLLVDRVELAGVNRCRPDNAVLLPTARRMLSRIVLDQYKSLRDCCSALSTFDENNVDDSIEVPEVITLAWLKSMRHELADLLSFQLSQLMSSLEMLHGLSRSDSAHRRRFCASMSTAMESTGYLSSLFSLSPAIPESFDMLQSDLHTLCRQFNTASAALWACQKLCMQDIDGERAESNTSGVLEFLEQIESLLHSVDDVKERLGRDLNATANDREAMDRNEEMAECLDKSTRGHSDPEDYEHSGQSFDASSRNDNGDIVKNKTVVFSASGAMQQLASDKGKANTLTNPPRQSVATQRMVFEELQERLAKMDRVEEVGADGTRLLESDTQRVVREKRPSTSSMFLGASGDILTELKNSIKNGEGWSSSLDA